VVIWRKNKAGVEWHSKYRGTSNVPAIFSEEVMHKYVEPFGVFFIGALLTQGGPTRAFGVWLVFSSVALLTDVHLSYEAQRQRFLDARDAQIEAKNMGNAMAGKPASMSAGFTVYESTRQLFKSEGNHGASSQLPADLEGLLTK
jgi:hypothetical protein